MKRNVWMLAVCILLIVCTAAAAEKYPGQCPHVVVVFDQLRDEHKDTVMSFTEEATGFVSGICEFCSETFIFCTSSEAPASKLVCDGTTHIYQRAAEILEEGWYGDDPVGHTYRVYRAAKCVYCNERVKCYARAEKMDDAGLQQHNWTEYGSLGYHVEGEMAHVYIVTCTDCGFVATIEFPCIMYDHHVCSEEINKARQFYIDN